jgi:hypothetical protein
MATFGGVGMNVFMQQVAESSDPATVFGSVFWLVIALDVINTLIALYFLWRIWFRRTIKDYTSS